jgi:hypothetical protein
MWVTSNKITKGACLCLHYDSIHTSAVFTAFPFLKSTIEFMSFLNCVCVSNGVMSYRQVEQLVAYYRDTLKKKVLIMLHIRRTEEELVPMKDRALVQSWKDSKHLYCCYPGNNDDWYWLYAAIFFGARTLVVTNDEMRDHHFQMLHLRSFVRWKERHQVRYELSGYQRKDITVYEPTKYSIRSQRIGRNWYFPNADGNAKEWLCIHQVAKVSTAHET